MCIAGVRKISWDTGEMCEFASALISALESLGQNVLYPFVMGTCGAAFRFTLKPGAWDFGNYSYRNITADPHEPPRRAFAALGREYIFYEKGSMQDDAARIRGSIARGVPVLAYPVVGPSDCCVIAGYDDGGEVLLGWSTFQDIPDDHSIPHDVTGYFRKPGWHDNLQGYMIIGKRKVAPPRRQVYLDTLSWAVELLRTPRVGENITGLAGMKAWAAEMTDEQYFPAGDKDTLGWRYVSAAVNMTMLRDHCTAETFLCQAAEDVPAFSPELTAAAECYHRASLIRDAMDSIISDGFSKQAMQAIAVPEERTAYAQKILEMCEQEEAAVGHIERLLARCS